MTGPLILLAIVALLTARPASRLLLAVAVVLAAVASHICSLFPHVPVRQEAAA